MIRKIIGLTFIFAFCTVFVSAQAQDEEDTGWITGEVTSIETGQDDSLMSIKLADGVIFNVAAANDLLGGIEVGDVVTVQIKRDGPIWSRSRRARECRPPCLRPRRKVPSGLLAK